MRPLALLLLLLSSHVGAELQEQLDYREYEVNVAGHTSLRQALNASSPIRHNGQIYHGYTQWHVDWRFYWRPQADGRCRIERVTTRLQATITLPHLQGAPAALQEPFRRYRAALHEHELGHYRYGQTAARNIDRALRDLPPQPDCGTLEQRANQTGTQLLEQQVAAERRYDQDTAYGKTQGAWLSD